MKFIPGTLVDTFTDPKDTLQESYLRSKYGIGVVDYRRMLAAQGGKCAICEKAPKKGRRLAVDHCHRTGKVRGLLCGSCNYSLGVWKDNPRRFSRAATYLLQSRSL